MKGRTTQKIKIGRSSSKTVARKVAWTKTEFITTKKIVTAEAKLTQEKTWKIRKKQENTGRKETKKGRILTTKREIFRRTTEKKWREKRGNGEKARRKNKENEWR